MKEDYVVCPICRDVLLALDCWLCEGDRVVFRVILDDIRIGLWDGIDDSSDGGE